jgi:hypothetical protein
MLPDPSSVTYNAVAKSLARGAGFFPGPVRRLGDSFYATADREFEMKIARTLMGNDVERTEILLSRTTYDNDANPHTGTRIVPNRFGVVYEVNTSRYDTETDIPLLRTALLSFVDTSTQSKLIAGEM